MNVSVLINNYNYARYLGTAIESVLAQKGPRFELIVVDDGSTDDSREVIARYGERVRPIFKPNGGQASSFNAGFAASRGDIVFLLDADDAFLPGKLARITAIYEQMQVDWCFDRVTVEENAAPPEELVVSMFDKRDRMKRGRFPTLPVPTSGLSFERRALARILPMPEARGVVLSDNYLKFAAAYLGRGVVVETPLTFQRIHGANRYSGAARPAALRPRIMVETGLELARRYDGLRGLGASLVAGGLAESGDPLPVVWSEICRCAEDGTFGGQGAARLAALVACKRLGRRLRARRGTAQ